MNGATLTRRAVLGGMAASAGLAARDCPARPRARPMFGVNCFDLFYRPFWSPAPDYDPEPRLRRLRDAGITLVRFSASMFWPREWAEMIRTPDRSRAILDAVFAAGERLGMRLVPSVIFAPAGISDHFREPFSAWGDPASQTRRFMAAHVARIVARYRSSPALFMWEFGNELNSFADMPDAERYAPDVNVAAGTPARRTAHDRLSGVAVMDVYRHFARIVRDGGSQHPIGTGSNLPRNDQMQDSLGRYGMDSPAQLAQAMAQCLAGDTNVLTIHLYPKSRRPRFRPQGSSYAEILGIARQVADAHRAQLFVSEFGVERSGDPDADRAAYAELLAALVEARPDHAALWNYDFPFQKTWDVSFDNDRAWMLEMLTQASR